MSTKFITVSIEIMHDVNINNSQKFILAEIEQLSHLELGCIASNKHFSDLIGITKENVSRNIRDLEDKKYLDIEIVPGSRNHTRIITLTDIVTPPYYNDKTPLLKQQETIDNKTTNKTINKSVSNSKHPTVDEIKSYIESKNLNVDANKFFNYFEAGNWVDSKGNKVKNWKQKVLTWDNHAPKQKKIKQLDYVIC